MISEKIEEFLKQKPGYLKKSKYLIAKKLGLELTDENLETIKKQIKSCIKSYREEVIKVEEKVKDFIEEIENTKKSIEKYQELNNINNVLVIGDIHEPFCLEDYRDFCYAQYLKYNCNKVIFIGDIIDQHFSSFHPIDPDGFSAGDELDRAITKIADWYKLFPEATVILGNHDRLAYRKAYSGGLSSRWLRSYGDVLNTPNWSFVEKIKIDDVLYIHGEGGTARMKAKEICGSVVQGHLHSQSYVEYINNKVFGMQVGCGINEDLYAFNYNKAGKDGIVSCAVVLEGKPILIKK